MEGKDMQWFVQTYHISRPKNADFLKVSQRLYNEHKFTDAVHCLQLFLSRKPQLSDLIPCLHLLALCHTATLDFDKARDCFLGCVRLGFDEDWQMVVQVEVDRNRLGRPSIVAERYAAAEQQLELQLQQQRHQQQLQQQQQQQQLQLQTLQHLGVDKKSSVTQTPSAGAGSESQSQSQSQSASRAAALSMFKAAFAADATSSAIASGRGGASSIGTGTRTVGINAAARSGAPAAAVTQAALTGTPVSRRPAGRGSGVGPPAAALTLSQQVAQRPQAQGPSG